MHERRRGNVAGFSVKGRWRIKADGLAYARASLVYLAVHGSLPPVLADHRDRDPANDGADNIRAATGLENAWNHRPRRKKSPLPPGVRESRRGRFEARITARGQAIHLGTFSTADAAASAYQTKRAELFGEFA